MYSTKIGILQTENGTSVVTSLRLMTELELENFKIASKNWVWTNTTHVLETERQAPSFWINNYFPIKIRLEIIPFYTQCFCSLVISKRFHHNDDEDQFIYPGWPEARERERQRETVGLLSMPLKG